MPYQPVEVVQVLCWDFPVGAVAVDDKSGFYVFEYDRKWMKLGQELAPTTMPTKGVSNKFVFATLPRDTFHGLPSMIADSLPDDFGNSLTTSYLSSKGVKPEQITALDRLAYLGNRGMGSLEFRPQRGPKRKIATAIHLSELVVAARSAMAGNIASQSGITNAISNLIAVGTSAGGARAKAVIALNPVTNELRSGQVPADPGFEQWLLKLDGVNANLDLGKSGNFGRVEFAYYHMALEAGIEMTECRLLEEGGRAHFMTRRFDRTTSGEKVHTQTLCAMGQLDFRSIGTHDYSQLFEQIDNLDLGADAQAEAFRRMVFNVAAANCDDHTKNFSFLLPKSGQWRLSPAYDVTHAHAPGNQWTGQHLMAVNGHSTGITRTDLNEVGDRFGVPGASHIVDQVLEVVSKWSAFGKDAGVPEVTINEIAAHIEFWSAPLR